MFEPIRGGTRGGQAEFKWTDVSADKDREVRVAINGSSTHVTVAHTHIHNQQNYLGHSINAPTGRWQKNKDVHWYARDQQNEDEARAEIGRVKAAEAEAMSVALYVRPWILPVYLYLTVPLEGLLPPKVRTELQEPTPSLFLVPPAQ
jgi:hypothetical protein